MSASVKRIVEHERMQILCSIPEHADTLTQIAFDAKRHWNYPESWIAAWSPLLVVSPAYIAENEVWELVVDGEIIGFYALAGQPPVLALDNLWVLPRAFGKGYGRALFEHAAERARALGARSLEVESDPHAQGFYERMGAKKIGERRSEVAGQERLLPVLQLRLAIQSQ